MANWWHIISRAFAFGTNAEAKNKDDTDTSSNINSLDEAGSCLTKVTGKAFRPYSTRDFGREEFSGARSVLVDESQAEQLLQKIRNRLGPGLVAFVGTCNSHAKPKPKGVELVIGCGSSQFDILRIAASDAVNFGKDTEDLIKQIQTWDTAYGINIFQAETDTIRLTLTKIPDELKKFAEEVYEFCPDIVDQGVGSVDKLAEDIGATRKLLLWWD
jgi:Domain of unknown function (DUF4253)